MASRCFVRGTCLDPEMSPHKGGHIYMFSAATVFPRLQPPRLRQVEREQTGKDGQSQKVYYRYIQYASATPPRTPGPRGLLQAVAGVGAAHSPVPSLPWAELQPEACGERASPRPSRAKWHLQLEAGGERKTVLSFDVPPVKSLRGCGAGRRSTFCKNKLSQELTAWL